MSFQKYLLKGKCLAVAIPLTYFPVVQAEPAISSVTGEVTPGATLQITGSGFGVNPNPAPFKWDDFEDGELGAEAETGGWEHYGNVGPVYSDQNPHSGEQSLLRQTDSSRDDFNSAGLKGLDSDEMYLSTWFYWEEVSSSSDGSPVVKVLRVNSRPEGHFYSGSNSSPSLWITQQPRGDQGWTYAGFVNDSGGFTDQQDLPTLNAKLWHRIEVFIRLSTPGGSNGEAKVWIDGELGYDHKTGETRWSNEVDKKLDNFLLPAMIDEGGQVMNYFVDDVYVDRTQARVELCMEPSWSDCQTKAIQLPASWSDTSITVETRFGTLRGGDLYLYVIDSDGDVNSNGYKVSVRAPKPPSNVTVN